MVSMKSVRLSSFGLPVKPDPNKDVGAGLHKDMSIHELKARLGIISMVIKEAREDGDPRWKNIVPQQCRLNALLVAKIKARRIRLGHPEPLPVKVGMRVACLYGRAARSGQ